MATHRRFEIAPRFATKKIGDTTLEMCGIAPRADRPCSIPLFDPDGPSSSRAIGGLRAVSEHMLDSAQGNFCARDKRLLLRQAREALCDPFRMILDELLSLAQVGPD